MASSGGTAGRGRGNTAQGPRNLGGPASSPSRGDFVWSSYKSQRRPVRFARRRTLAGPCRQSPPRDDDSCGPVPDEISPIDPPSRVFVVPPGKWRLDARSGGAEGLGRGRASTWLGPPAHGLGLSTWLILPVVICLSQRLSHACPSTSLRTKRNCEWLIKSVMVPLIVAPYSDNCGNSRANTCE